MFCAWVENPLSMFSVGSFPLIADSSPMDYYYFIWTIKGVRCYNKFQLWMSWDMKYNTRYLFKVYVLVPPFCILRYRCSWVGWNGLLDLFKAFVMIDISVADLIFLFFYRHVFHHKCATCSKLPSNNSFMLMTLGS